MWSLPSDAKVGPFTLVVSAMFRTESINVSHSGAHIPLCSVCTPELTVDPSGPVSFVECSKAGTFRQPMRVGILYPFFLGY